MSKHFSILNCFYKQRFGASSLPHPYPYPYSYSLSSTSSSSSSVPLFPNRHFLSWPGFSQESKWEGIDGLKMGAFLIAFLLIFTVRSCCDRTSFLIRNSSSLTSLLTVKAQMELENRVQQVGLLNAVEDSYNGVMVEMKEPMDSKDFVPLLRASISQWRQQGKKGVWIKLPIKLANLVESVVQEGFRYHHAEPDYLMLVYWIPNAPSTLPINASHRVGIGAFVINVNREVLVVQEKSGEWKDTGVWKLPTGVVNEGEDIWNAAIREVKEETGIETEFVEVLAFRQSHQSFFNKSDLFFVCMLRPRTLDIHKQDSEVVAAQWMPIQSYVDQPYNKDHQLFKYVAEICKTKSERNYAGFSAMPMTTASDKETLYFNNMGFNKL